MLQLHAQLNRMLLPRNETEMNRVGLHPLGGVSTEYGAQSESNNDTFAPIVEESCPFATQPLTTIYDHLMIVIS
jgi:hypothetical protein